MPRGALQATLRQTAVYLFQRRTDRKELFVCGGFYLVLRAELFHTAGDLVKLMSNILRELVKRRKSLLAVHPAPPFSPSAGSAWQRRPANAHAPQTRTPRSSGPPRQRRASLQSYRLVRPRTPCDRTVRRNPARARNGHEIAATQVAVAAQVAVATTVAATGVAERALFQRFNPLKRWKSAHSTQGEVPGQRGPAPKTRMTQNEKIHSRDAPQKRRPDAARKQDGTARTAMRTRGEADRAKRGAETNPPSTAQGEDRQKG